MPFREFVLQTRAACRLELREQFQTSPAIPFPPVSHTDDLSIDELTRRMQALPDRYLHVLLLRFGCGISYGEIDAILDATQSAGTAAFALQLLAHGLSLSAPPGAEALQAAADRILRTLPGAQTTMPSKACRNAMCAVLQGGGAPAKAKRPPLRALIAAAVIAALILALAAVTVAALLRNSFHWSITQTDEGMVIRADDILREPTMEDYEELRRYHPSPLPDGFAHAYTDDREANYLTDYYHSGDGQRIVLWKALAGPSAVFGIADEEVDSFEQIDLDGATYLYYEQARHGRGVVCWEIDGYAFMLVSPFGRDETLAVARSVSR